MRLTDGTPRGRLALALDLVALLLFVVAGMRNHATGSQADIFLRNAVPVTAAWLLAAFLLRTYRPPTLRSLALTWLVAIPVGVLVRTWWVGSPTGGRIAVFLGVAMAFTGLFLLGGRLAGAYVGRWLAAREGA
jgi:hypothetical protein